MLCRLDQTIFVMTGRKLQKGDDQVSVDSKIKGIIADQLEVAADKLTMETTFEDIDADSLDIVELVMALEEEFDLEFPDRGAKDSVFRVIKNLSRLDHNLQGRTWRK